MSNEQINSAIENLRFNRSTLEKCETESSKKLVLKAISINEQLIRELQEEEKQNLSQTILKTKIMKFFQTLESQFPDADLTIRIKSKGGIQSISVLPVSTEENEIQPLIVSGTPQELDEQFFELIKKPLETTIAAIVNLEEQEKSVKASAEKPDPATAKKSTEPAKKDAKKVVSKKEITAPAEGSLFEEPEVVEQSSASTDTNDDDQDDKDEDNN